jgi:glyoxylase-like metal-dependent hydrolase (beta-lactamase superfamily II)
MNRRDFLHSAALPLAAADSRSAGKPTETESGFAPNTEPRKITDNLFVFEDTCNVYIVKDGSKAVLIDFGSGRVMNHLGAIGVNKVEWILHTHHHRDQCQGDRRATARGIPIAVPAHERHLFADAENFWRNRRVFHLYYVRNDFNTITRNISVARALEDYTTLKWGPYDFQILPTPGHTLGSITLLATIDGRRVAFSGDLVYAPGKIVNLFDTQVNYGGEEGIDLGIYSMTHLLDSQPQMLCPSHGDVMPDAAGALNATIRSLRSYYGIQFDTLTADHRPYAVSPHLIASYQTMSSFYAIVSDSGKALFIDYGSASTPHFTNFERATATDDRIRFVEHSITDLQRRFGMKTVDVAMPSHMHDDHMNGFPHLKRHYGTKVWCYENMIDVFENPRGYNLGCVLGEAFKVDRAFRNGDRFRWEEFEFEITHSPGHTEYQMALFATIDGQKVAFTGDAFHPPNRADASMRHSLIFRNHVENDSHLKSIRNLIDHEPALILPGHGKPFALTREMMLATEQKFRRQQQAFIDILPDGETDFGLDPSWVSIYPYQLLLTPGNAQTVEIRVQNYKPEAIRMEVALVAPAEWNIEPRSLKFEVPANAKAKHPVQVMAPRGWIPNSPRFAIACDVMRDGRYLGQITEAVVELA